MGKPARERDGLMETVKVVGLKAHCLSRIGMPQEAASGKEH